jgi:preprotein translocase subunit SecA
MLGAVANLFGSPQARAVRSLRREVEAVNKLEPKYASMSDGELSGVTAALRRRHAEGEGVDGLLPDAFAAVREAAKRVLGQRPYDVQVMGGVVLHRGNIAEMKTGEGKTLVAVMPAYLNAIPGEGVHVVTVNDYLARRDSMEMGRVFAFLGMATGCVLPEMAAHDRRAAYAADVTYVVNSELGFDYLRDNMKMARGEQVLRPFRYAIVDEVDSILIDEARTPLIISGRAAEQTGAVGLADTLVGHLAEGDWEVDLRQRTACFTDAGLARLEGMLRGCGLLSDEGHLHDGQHSWTLPFLHQALRARLLYERDKHYIVHDGKLMIVDENTGRIMDGRRWSDGLHQAMEAKERVEVQPENHTLASVTYQNFFHLYPKLSGMTGTAQTDAVEFSTVYGLDVVQIPTNKPVARADHDDEIYRTSDERDEAVAALVAEASSRGQPVLVGTSSIERSETLSALFERRGIRHAVLNARHHEQEAHIIAQAGRPGAVTIATNMAGRGTDIKLGGNVDFLLSDTLPPDAPPEVAAVVREQLAAQVAEAAGRVRAAGGLLVVGTERHESRRVDDQLRGRSGRQGDPGASKFLISLGDELMRRFGGERLAAFVGAAGLKPGEPIVHPWVSRSVRKAQERIEAQNFEARLNLIKYDAAVNSQRKAFYARRAAMMDSADIAAIVVAMRDDAVGQICAASVPAGSWPEQWDVVGLASDFERLFGFSPPLSEWAAEEGVGPAEMVARARKAVADARAAQFAGVDPAAVAMLERSIVLQSMDAAWRDHLASLDHLREGIGLRAIGQRNPLHEWNVDAADMFEHLFDRAAEQAVAALSRLTLVERLAEAPQIVVSEEAWRGDDVVVTVPSSARPRDADVALPLQMQ